MITELCDYYLKGIISLHSFECSQQNTYPRLKKVSFVLNEVIVGTQKWFTWYLKVPIQEHNFFLRFNPLKDSPKHVALHLGGNMKISLSFPIIFSYFAKIRSSYFSRFYLTQRKKYIRIIFGLTVITKHDAGACQRNLIQKIIIRKTFGDTFY